MQLPLDATVVAPDGADVRVEPDVCLTIPLGTAFQFRPSASETLKVVALTMPPWPGEAEAVRVRGRWDAG